MAAVMVVALVPLSAFATEGTPSATEVSATEDLFEVGSDAVTDEVENLYEDWGFDVTTTGETKNGEDYIKLEYDDIESTVVIDESSDEELALMVIEGNKTNIVEFTDSGEIIVDGSTITTEFFEETILGDSVGVPAKDVFANQAENRWADQKPLYGSASDYTAARKTYTLNYNLNKEAAKLTVAALVLVVAVVPIPQIKVLGTVISGIAFVGALYNYLNKNDPKNKGISLKGTVSVHKSRGALVKNNGIDMFYSYKHTVGYYSKKDAKGTKVGTNTFFEHATYPILYYN
jgi:hypothetical protein